MFPTTSFLFYAAVTSLITSQVSAVAGPNPKDLQVPSTSNATQLPEPSIASSPELISLGRGGYNRLRL
jgi:hypothetical protein